MRKRIVSVLTGALIAFGINASAETTIEPTILVDQDGILITATGLECEGIKGELKLDIENNSDKDVSIISGSIGFNHNAINNYMTDECYVNVDVGSGKKAKESVKFGAWYNAYMDFSDIASITMAFQVKDDDHDTLFYSDPVEIKTSAYDSYDFNDNPFARGVQDKQVQKDLSYKLDEFKEGEFFSCDGVVINDYAILRKSDDTIGIFLEVENTTDSVMVFGVNAVEVNGIEVYYGNWTSETILSHTKTIVEIGLDDVLTNYYGNAVISDIKQVALTLVTKDAEYNDLNSEKISILGDTDSYEVDFSGTEFYNINGIRMVSKGIVEDRFGNGDKIFVALVENDNDFEIILRVDDDFSVNDYMIDTTAYSTSINANSTGIFYFELDGDSLEDCGIDSFDKIEGAIEIKDVNWNNLDTASIQMSF